MNVVNAIKKLLMKHINEIIYTFFLFVTILFITFSTSQAYQTDKDYYFFIAMIFFSVFCIYLADLKRKSRCIIVIFIGAIVALCYFEAKGITAESYGPVYSKVLMLHAILFVINAAAILELLVSGDLYKRIKKKSILWWLFVVSTLIVSVIDLHLVVPLVIPIVVFLLCDIDGEKWRIFTNSICVAYCCCFSVLFTKSILTNQDNLFGRYYGDFLNVGAGAMFAGGATLCSVVLLYNLIRQVNRKWFWIACTFAVLIYSLYALMIFESRGTVFGVGLAIAGFWIFGCSKERRAVIRKVVICLVIGIILIALAFFTSIILNKINPEIDGSYPYWEYRIAQLTRDDFHTDNLGDNSLLNTIDTFSSGRISVMIPAIKQIRPWPVKFSVEIDGVVGYSAHNFFLSWLLDYGAIVGFLFIVWYVMYLIKGIRMWKDDKELAMLPLLWHFYCFGAFMFLTNHWNMILPFMLLVLQYPIISRNIQIAE